MLSAGSLGQYSFQFNITVKNNYNSPITPEICIITKNDGIFVTQQGTSIIYTGILDKATVLKAKEGDVSLDYNSHQRLVGGRLNSSGFGAIKKMLKNHIMSANPHPQLANAMEGSGMGAGISGGSTSGGRRHKLNKHLL